MTTGQLRADQTVVIVGRRITAVKPGVPRRLPQGTQVVDARGKYMIPGLWDMHVHVWAYAQVAYPLLIANSVTGIREMNTPYLDSLLKWRREIVAGRRVGPRIVGTGGFLGSDGDGIRMYDFDGPSPEIPVPTPDAARRAVDSLKAAGVDFIKVRGGVPRNAYFAAANEARRLGIPLAGHLSDSVTVQEASDSGQRSIEHHVALPECSDAGSDEACAAVAARLRRNGTWLTPTIVVGGYFAGGLAPDHMRYWPDSLADRVGSSMLKSGGRPVVTNKLARYGRAGVPLLAGSDASPAMPEDVPGFSLHEELAFFVEGGLSPLEALQTATLNPAHYLNATDSLGAVAPGKLADVVLLEANPLTDIHNTTKIVSVVADGRYFDRARLDALIAGVERHAPAP